MCHTDIEPGGGEPGTDLHDASWVSGRNQCRPGSERRDFFDLRIEDGSRHGGPYDGIEAGTPAALMGTRKDLHSEAWHCRKDIKGLADDALSVLKMARSVVRDVKRHGCAAAGPDLGEEFRDVLNPAGQISSRLGFQEATIVLEERATTGAVDQDQVCPVGERGHVGSGEGLCRAVCPGVIVESTAAHLAGHVNDGVAIGGEGPPSGRVDMVEEGVHDATTEERNGGSGSAIGFHDRLGAGLSRKRSGTAESPPALPGGSQHSHGKSESALGAES